MLQELLASRMGWVGNLYQTFQAYKTNAELKNDPNPVLDSALKCSALAAVAGTGYMAFKYSAKADRAKFVLIDEADAIYTDAHVLEHIYKLQKYRDLQKYLFQEMVECADQLIFLERGMRSSQIAAKPSDRFVAYDYYRRAFNSLKKIQLLIRQDLSPEHAVASNILIQEIQRSLAIYYENIVKMTSEFKLENTLKRADADVAKAMKRIRMQQKRERMGEMMGERMMQPQNSYFQHSGFAEIPHYGFAEIPNSGFADSAQNTTPNDNNFFSTTSSAFHNPAGSEVHA